MTDHTPRHTPAPPAAAPTSRRTINSKGEIVERPYGSSRWATPKRYQCAHTGCPVAAFILKPANAHPAGDGIPSRAHNCCGTHDDAGHDKTTESNADSCADTAGGAS